MPKAWKTCSTPGCPELIPAGQSRCDDCTTASRAASSRRRGSATSRGYGTAHRKIFREGVLARNPICVVCVRVPATVADHYPLSRRDLEAIGADPNDPVRGRGLCEPCHNKATAEHQPGGWYAANVAN